MKHFLFVFLFGISSFQSFSQCDIDASNIFNAYDIVASQDLILINLRGYNDGWIRKLELFRCVAGHTLYVVLRTEEGARYVMRCPSEEEFIDFADAPSPGSYFHAIRYTPDWVYEAFLDPVFKCMKILSTGIGCSRNRQTDRSFCYQH